MHERRRNNEVESRTWFNLDLILHYICTLSWAPCEIYCIVSMDINFPHVTHLFSSHVHAHSLVIEVIHRSNSIIVEASFCEILSSYYYCSCLSSSTTNYISSFVFAIILGIGATLLESSKKKKQQLHIQIINEYVSPPLLIIIHQITNSTPNLGRLSLIISNCLCLYMPISGCINKKAHKNIREKKLQVFSGWWRWRLCQASNTSYTPNGLPLYVVIKQRAATQPNIQRV